MNPRWPKRTDAKPRKGWDAILAEVTPRPGLSSLLDRLDAEYSSEGDKFLPINDASLAEYP